MCFDWLRSAARRYWRGWLLAAVVAALVAIFAPFALSGWRTVTAANGVTCELLFQPLKATENPYIEFFVERQELIEPLFDGGYFMDLTDEHGANALRVAVTTSGARGYGNSVSFADLYWDNQNQQLWMRGKANMDFVAQSGSHRMFPFDSAKFEFSLRTDPLVNLPVFRFTNRVPGFVMPCGSVKVMRRAGTFHVTFQLRRDAFITFSACFLFAAALVICFALAIFVDVKALPVPVASFFFSLWSIRSIFGLGAQGFPTLFDVGILLLGLLMVCVLIISAVRHWLYRPPS